MHFRCSRYYHCEIGCFKRIVPTKFPYSSVQEKRWNYIRQTTQTEARHIHPVTHIRVCPVLPIAFFFFLAWHYRESVCDRAAIIAPCHRLVENAPIMPNSHQMRMGKSLRYAACGLWQDNYFAKLTASAGIFSYKNESMIIERKAFWHEYLYEK